MTRRRQSPAFAPACRAARRLAQHACGRLACSSTSGGLVRCCLRAFSGRASGLPGAARRSPRGRSAFRASLNAHSPCRDHLAQLPARASLSMPRPAPSNTTGGIAQRRAARVASMACTRGQCVHRTGVWTWGNSADIGSAHPSVPASCHNATNATAPRHLYLQPPVADNTTHREADCADQLMASAISGMDTSGNTVTTARAHFCNAGNAGGVNSPASRQVFDPANDDRIHKGARLQRSSALASG